MRLSLSTLGSLGLLIGLGIGGIQCAYADAPPPQSADATLERLARAPATPQVELVDEGSQSLPTYEQGGRRYVLGQMGQRYQVRIVNPTGSRVEAVVSVDGLDAIDGRPGSLAKRGYLVPAYGEVTIDGFRTSLESVAAFRFSSVRDSYAARTRHARNVGVVGVAFFRERPAPLVANPMAPPVKAAPAPSPSPVADDEPAPPSAAGEAGSAPSPATRRAASGAPAASRPGLGTQFGERLDSRVVETEFERASSSPMAVSEVRYDDRDGLLSRGIQLSPPVRDPRAAENDLRDTAQPFPQSRFAQPPP
jgi:hypothetical protein